MRVVLFGVLCLLAGCGYRATTEPAVQKAILPEFQTGEIAPPIDFDLVGTWEVMRFGTAEKPQKGERWETKWTLKKTRRDDIWEERDGPDVFRLLTVPCGPVTGQILSWQRPDGTFWNFSINEQKFGFLMMTGEDGDRYMALRTEGGERAKPRPREPIKSLDAPEQLAPLSPMSSRPRLIVDGFTIEERCDKKWYEVETGERVMFMEWTTTDGVVHRRLMPNGGGEVEKRLKAAKQRQAAPPPPAPVGHPSIEHPR